MTDIKSGPDRPPPWGYLATFGWALLAGALSTVATVLVAMAWTGSLDLDQPEALEGQPLNFLLAAVSGGTVIAAGLLAARLRHWSAREYLGLIQPGRPDIAIAVALVLVIGAADYAVVSLLGGGMPQPQLDQYLNAKLAGALPLFWIDWVVIAPVSEELVFRGFLQRGWVRSQYGAIPGIVVISAVWAVAHVQYNWLHLSSIFLSGLLFGWIRWRSGSTLLPIVMHAILNAGAGAATMVNVEWS